ncbi:MAG: elongation factor P maturation arginine rhamnosyltransferase EarP [Burkholderiaceae bacterium]|nr:elongation factor P maturation arginine rhamnosyltransferase EarP [Burkholderiaceae bacterium]
MPNPRNPPPALWDIFCRVIDNHGDLGVCWRLSRQLAARGHAVRLWVDDPRALRWMAPGALQGALANITVLPWTQPFAPLPDSAPCADVWIEAFGCDIPPEFIASRAQRVAANIAPPPVWINLEYLSAERHVERLHGLPSPVLHGPAAGWTKWFYYPGFTPATGGLLHEDDLPARQAAFDRAAWRRAQGVPAGALAASLFCYEPPALPELLARWRQSAQPTRLFVTAGRAADAARQAMRTINAPSATVTGTLTPAWLPYLPQTAYDELLWGCDLNFVRGEDSLVRALLAGQPLVWHIYPQHDGAHHAKLQAFLDWLDAPPSLRDFHRAWNGIASTPLPALELDAWRECASAARARLLAQLDLASQLTRFVTSKRQTIK